MEIAEAQGEAAVRAPTPSTWRRFSSRIFWAKLGDHAKAIEEALDYIKNYPNAKERSADAMNLALAASSSCGRAPRGARSTADELITRTWKLAVDRGMKQYAFVYGKRLSDHAKTPADYKAAAAALHAVPENHPAVLHARLLDARLVRVARRAVALSRRGGLGATLLRLGAFAVALAGRRPSSPLPAGLPSSGASSLLVRGPVLVLPGLTAL